MTEREALTRGFEYHRIGDLAQAEQIYRDVLSANPSSSDALYLLGLLASQVGQDPLAVELLKQAAVIAPKNSEILQNLGRIQAGLHQLEQARQSYQAVLAIEPQDADAHASLARILCLQGDFRGGLAAYQRAAELDPDNPDLHNNLGATLQQLGQMEAAMLAYERAVYLRPGFVVAINNLGLLAMQQGDPQTAVAWYRKSLASDATVAETYCNLAIAYQALFQLEAAVDAYRQAIDLKPDYAEAYNNLATVLQDLGMIAQAVEIYQQSISLSPAMAVTHKNLGNALRELNQHPQAALAYESALRLKPEFSEAALGLLQERQHLCHWQGQPALADQVIASVEADQDESEQNYIAPFSFITLPVPTTPAQQLRCAKRWARQRYPTYQKRWTADRVPPRSQITVGYLSADFHEHATAWLIAELIEAHDREHFRIAGFSYGPDDHSPIRQRLAGAFDRFHDIRRHSIDEAADQIAAEEVDILVDLKGYTRHARTEILARRPAPIQVHFLGYPGTMGTDFIDYLVVDHFVVPADQHPHYSECLVHLPGCYQVNDGRGPTAVETPTRAECGLPEAGLVFCSFNHHYKLTPEIFDIWMRLLRAAPASVLWLLDTNPWAVANLRREAAARDVDAARLVFAPQLPNAQHLARQRLADLFLDSFPVSAHTTASDALRMGLPIVSLVGETFISRVAGSLLETLGLPELVARDYREYEAIALRLAQQPAELLKVRRRLSENLTKSTLYDGRAFSKKLEKAYHTMWQTYESRQPPQAFSVSEDEEMQ